MEEFKIKAYGIAELAAKYSPDSADSTARKKLNHWIDRYPGLRQQLTALGFRPKARIFTPAQVRAIVEALGEPWRPSVNLCKLYRKVLHEKRKSINFAEQ